MTLSPIPFARSHIGVPVVDDEPLLLTDATGLVGDAGFSVYGAADAAQTLARLERHDDIRILFTDIDMPGTMNGLRLAHPVRSRGPQVSIIVASGHVRPSAGDPPERGLLLGEPYPPGAVTTALDGLARDLPIGRGPAAS